MEPVTFWGERVKHKLPSGYTMVNKFPTPLPSWSLQFIDCEWGQSWNSPSVLVIAAAPWPDVLGPSHNLPSLTPDTDMQTPKTALWVTAIPWSRARTGSFPRWLRISFSPNTIPQWTEHTELRWRLPYKLMNRIQLSTTSGIACPESLRKTKKKVSFIRLGIQPRKGHCKHNDQVKPED